MVVVVVVPPSEPFASDQAVFSCRYAESIHACEQVLSLNPQHYMALSGKGLCHIYLHEHKEAEICLREALQINPFLTQFRRFLSASENGEL